MRTKIKRNEIKVGMFVSELDRPWEESSFLIQGFLLKTQEDVQEVKAACEFIYIDLDRSDAEVCATYLAHKTEEVQDSCGIIKQQVISKTPAETEVGLSADKDDITENMNVAHSFEKSAIKEPEFEHVEKVRDPEEAHHLLGLPGEYVKYEVTSPLEEEFSTAKGIQLDLTSAIQDTLDSFGKEEIVSFSAIKEPTKDMVSSVIRNPDAAHLLCQLKEKDSLSFSHSVAASILAVLFGRHLGLDEDELNTLAQAALLLDIGKMSLPTGLLHKIEPISIAEAKVLRKHVDHSVKLLKQAEDVDSVIVEIVETHHERYDGKGYPHGLKGDSIPVLGRMASIVDFYDAITHERPYRGAVSPSYAINALYERKGKNFQEELIEEFIQCLGVYPTGSLVLLSSGEVGVVIQQNELRRLRPKCLIVRDTEKREIENPFTMDLEYERLKDDGERLFILTSLEPGAYGISDDDYYL